MTESETQQTQQLISELEDMAMDPTLDQCCRRDMQSRIQKERVRHSLQQQDRIDARQRIAAAAICRDPQTLEELQQQQQHEEQHEQQHRQREQGGDDRDGSDELAQLRQQRLQQLQAQAAVQQQHRLSGFGALNDVPESQLLALLAEPPGHGLLVVHLAVKGHQPGAALDEILTTAAAHYRGTYFARTLVDRRSSLVAQLQLPAGAPALLVARSGRLLGKAPLSQFGPRGQEVWEEEVSSYLRRFKVLSAGSASSSAPAAHTAAAGGAGQAPRRRRHSRGSDDSDSDADSDVSQGDAAAASSCELCGRNYPHQHVRAALPSTQHSDDDDL